MHPPRKDLDAVVSLAVLLLCAFLPILTVSAIALALSASTGPVAGLSLLFSVPAAAVLLAGALRARAR